MVGIIVAILLVGILFVPEVRHYKDGGTTEYHAIVYQIFDWHRMCATDASNVQAYYDGLEIRILGFTIYNNAKEYAMRVCDEI